jgi:chromosome segregation ATPase
MATGDVRNEIAELERELQLARQTAEESHAALSALEEQRREREGRLAVALGAQKDFERRLEEKQVELRRAEAEAALEALKAALGERDGAAEAFASAARSVVSRLQDVDAAQESVESAWQAFLSSRGPAADEELPSEDLHASPSVFTDALEMLTETVSERADQNLERDLVEAAARSPLGNDISTLPTHLQGLARARYFAIARERRLGQSNDAERRDRAR